MARISPALLKAYMAKTGLSRAATYARIKQVANSEFLSLDLAAIKVAAATGLPVTRYAKDQDLAALRSRGDPVAPPAMPAPVPTVAAGASRRARTSSRKPRKGAAREAPNKVFVVHGRDRPAREAMHEFIRALGVTPIEWNSAVKMTKKAAPHVADIFEKAFENARAIVVLMTPDDLAQLRSDLLGPSDPAYERILTGQARANVLFEAGRAFATHPDRTVIVQLGNLRPFTDIAGLHVVHMSNEFDKRQELATKLENAGCDIDTSGPDWVKAGDFTDPSMRVPPGGGRRRMRHKGIGR